MRTRFAPSPTGDLHVGSAWTALASWVLAKAAFGLTVLRIEDIDAPRIVAGSASRIAADLDWLGLTWDEGPTTGGPYAPYVQSECSSIYEEALASLDARGLLYPCDCSRAEIARVASAPHQGEEVVYPGTCRDLPPNRAMKRPPAIRLRVPEGAVVSFVDRMRGPVEQRVDRSVGDFVLRRGDGVFAYQFVVAVDDARMRITDVVRASDLLGSTARQLLLMQMLGVTEVPTYMHLPMVIDARGDRLAKRSHALSVRELRERGTSAREIIGSLAHGLRLVSGPVRPMTAIEVASVAEHPSNWRRTDWPVPESWIPITEPSGSAS